MEQFTSYLALHPLIALAITFWSLPWKGIALWKAAQRKEKWWFIIMLVVNILGLLEIAYIFYFSKKPIAISENKSTTV